MAVELGDEVKDLVSGFQGVVTSVTDSLNGCRRMGIQPHVKEDGKHPDAWVIDETQLEIITKGKVKGARNTAVGGPPERIKCT